MPALPTQLGYGDYLRFRDLVLERSGLFFPEKKRQDLEAGLLKALQSTPEAISEFNTYYDFLKKAETPAAKAEMGRLINLLTIGETHFFRNEAQFDALARKILPDLIAQKRAQAKAAAGLPGIPIKPQLRLWSAGCASGEEPYSLAILLRELIPDISDWSILILATDINQNSLLRAKEALYSNWSFRETRALALRPHYFTPEGSRYRLRTDVRQMVTFAPLNLIEDDFPAIANNTVSLDLIVCRNVTIYFTEEITRSLVRKFHAALVDGGWLLVGHSEPSLTNYRDFQMHIVSDALFYQKTKAPPPWPADWDLSPGERTGPVTPPPPIAPPSSATIAFQPKPTPPKGNGAGRGSGVVRPGSKDTGPIQTETNPYDAARILLNNGQAAKAITVLENHVAQLPRSRQAAGYALLAHAYADQGMWEQARRWGEQAVALDTLQGEAYYVLALVDDHAARYPAAIANLKKVIYLDRSNPLPYFNLAMLYRKVGNTDQAQRNLRTLTQILAKWPPDELIPDSGGTTAGRLLTTAESLLRALS